MIRTWKQQFLAGATQHFEGEASSNGDQECIAELERMVGNLTMELEIAKKPRAYWMECGGETDGSDDDANRLSGENHLRSSGFTAHHLLSHQRCH